MSQSEDVVLSPTYHYDLAVSLSGEEDASKKEESIFEAAIAVALSTNPTAELPCCTLYCSLSGKDWRHIFLIRTALELQLHWYDQPAASVVFVLLPGDYLLLDPQPTVSCAILAAAPGVTFRSHGGHALWWSGHGDLVVRGISFALVTAVKTAQFACLCVSETASLRLINCHIRKWPKEAGILVAGGNCFLNACHISNTTKQAIEVREGGRLDVCNSQITNCFQGITAYGGARAVSVVNCTIRGMAQEGVFAAGSRVNEATAAQEYMNDSLRRNETSAKAVAWGNRQRLDLDLVVRNSTIESICKFGVSIDYGCHATIHNCEIRDCNTCCLSVKGESPALIADCVFNYNGAEGIRVGANYSAEVQLINNSFVGKSVDKAVIDEFNGVWATRAVPGAIGIAKGMGLWSCPVKQERSRHFTSEAERSKLGAAMYSTTNVESYQSTKLAPSPAARRPKVRILDLVRLSRVAAPVDTLALYYAIGNTHGFDVTGSTAWTDYARDDENGDALLQPVFNILLAACGDIRNILKTVHAASTTSSCDLHFMLNDSSISVLARDVLLLSLIEQETVSAKDLISIWANHALTPHQRKLVDELCERLSNDNWPSFLLFPVSDYWGLRDSLRECFRQWRTSQITLESVLHLRKSTLVEDIHKISLALTLRAVKAGSPVSRCDEKELSKYLRTGSLQWGNDERKKMTSANVTLMEAPQMQYNLYWSSSIFRAVRLCDPAPHQPETLTQRLVTTLIPQIRSVREAMRQGRIKFSLLLGDIVNCGMDLSWETWKHPALDRGSGDPQHWRVSKFHFIDVSNVSDYVSLPVVLQISSRYLDPSQSAIIHAQSVHWTGKASPYFVASFGMKRSIYSQILGLKLTNIQTSPTGHMHMIWRWGCKKEPAISLEQRVEHLISASRTICRPRAYSLAGLNSATSLLIAHLAFCTTESPAEAKSLISTIASSSDEARRYKWQLTLAGKLQSEGLDQIAKACVIATFVPVIDFFELLMYKMAGRQMPHLVLAVTSAPLTRGDSVAADKVLQFIDAFVFDSEIPRVQLILTKILLSRIVSKYYLITLCGCNDESGYNVTSLSHSFAMNDLDISEWKEDTHNILCLPKIWS